MQSLPDSTENGETPGLTDEGLSKSGCNSADLIDKGNLVVREGTTQSFLDACDTD